jgi:hypothetical protein
MTVASKLKKIGVLAVGYPNVIAAVIYAVVITGISTELINGGAHWSWPLFFAGLLCFSSLLSWIMLTKKQNWRWALFSVVVLGANASTFGMILSYGD